MFTEMLAELLPDDWEVIDSSVIVCPCGDSIELDGVCPQGHESPLMALGMI